MESIDWKNLKLIIFDVDGTLYNQKKLRKMMAFKLLSYYLLHFWKFRELLIILEFRKQREQNSEVIESNLDEAQYAWTANKLNLPITDVKKVIQKWIYTEPLKFIEKCKAEGLDDFLNSLRDHKIKIGIFSDYPVSEKLKAMQIGYELAACSTDSDINQLKPSSKGLEVLTAKLNINYSNALFIGDRFEKDGLAAEKISMPYFIIPKRKINSVFKDLKRNLDLAFKED